MTEDNPLVRQFFGRVTENGVSKSIMMPQVPSAQERIVLYGEELEVFNGAMMQAQSLLEMAHYPYDAVDKIALSLLYKLIIEESRSIDYQNDYLPKYEAIGASLLEIEAQLFGARDKSQAIESRQHKGPYYHKVLEPEFEEHHIVWYRGDGIVRYMLLFPIPNEDGSYLRYGCQGGYREIHDGGNMYHLESYNEHDPAVLAEFREKIVKQCIMSEAELEFFSG